ncbi:unnamed protein product [Urochloa humidicola]
MSIYGFVAVRDEVDRLRNYIFNRSREHAQEISPDSPDVSFIPPARGISARYDVIVEYNLKVKGNDDGGGDDEELIDGCFMFKESITRGELIERKVRLFTPVGPLDILFGFIRYAVEATIEVKVMRAMAGYCLSMVTATTCGDMGDVTLYDSRSDAPCCVPPMAPREKDLPSSAVAVAHAVMAVELGCNLKLQFEISRDEDPWRGLGRHADKNSHELLLRAQRHGSSKGAVVMGRMFKVAAKITWSTC